MKHYMKVLTPALASIVLAACAPQKIIPPESGPVARMSVNVTNFAERGVFKAENVWVSLYNQDESWGAQPVLVEDHPTDHYIIPANERLKFSLWLQVGGPGYDGGCYVGLDLTAEEASNLNADFSIKRVPGTDTMAGCKMTLSNNGKVIGEYEGKSELTYYKVKVSVGP